MKKILVLLALFVLVPVSSFAFSLSWGPVTTYTDNTAIGVEANGVFYNVEMDGAQVATRIAATSWTLPAVAKKSAHTFRAKPSDNVSVERLRQLEYEKKLLEYKQDKLKGGK